MSSPNDPVLCCPLPYRVAPVFVQVVSPPLGWSPLTSFLVIWSPTSGGARGPSIVFEAVDMPSPGPFHFSHSVDYIYEFCPLPDPDVGSSIFVCDVEHTSFHFGLCGRKFVLCLFGQCPGLCTICHSWQHTGVVHLSLQQMARLLLKISRCLAYNDLNNILHTNEFDSFELQTTRRSSCYGVFFFFRFNLVTQT